MATTYYIVFKYNSDMTNGLESGKTPTNESTAALESSYLLCGCFVIGYSLSLKQDYKVCLYKYRQPLFM